METLTYDRAAAVAYAHRWAYRRNPQYLDFSNLGGDCTNFASQSILAGSHGVMNFTPTYGWFYRTSSDRTASWTGVPYLYNFLTANTGAGPFGSETDLAHMEPGDVVQLQITGDNYHHTPVVVKVLKENPGLEDILVAAHSYDADYRPLSTYDAQRMRFIHIEGVRVPTGTAVPVPPATLPTPLPAPAPTSPQPPVEAVPLPAPAIPGRQRPRRKRSYMQ
jgi:hypothetical protein